MTRIVLVTGNVSIAEIPVPLDDGPDGITGSVRYGRGRVNREKIAGRESVQSVFVCRDERVFERPAKRLELDFEPVLGWGVDDGEQVGMDPRRRGRDRGCDRARAKRCAR